MKGLPGWGVSVIGSKTYGRKSRTKLLNSNIETRNKSETSMFK
jgi:hypothetical protein